MYQLTIEMNRVADRVIPAVHEVKCWPEFFQRVKHGIKTFEIRRDDRDYKSGDYLKQREWEPSTEKYTGEEVTHRIGYIMRGMAGFGLEKGFVAMQLIEDSFLEPMTSIRK